MTAAPNPPYEYQVGGSLKTNAPSYVERQADTDLYQALTQGELCYVFNSRQMGKSSLRLRTKQRLQQAGMSCASIDMTRIGSKTITAEQWYQGIVVDLVRGFDLFDRFNLTTWWNARQGISLIQRLSQFIEEVLLTQIPGEKIFIFLDEIDSVLSLNFSVDDFFALIRYCYNQRAENPAYDRLNWAFFGVATPSDLIQDPVLTPFNIGRPIDLQGFKLAEVQPLTAGLEGSVSNPQAVLKEILSWTEGQPFLTQKLCRIVAESRGREHEQARQANEETHYSYQLDAQLPIANPHLINFYYSLPVLAIEKFVRSRLIENWEAQDEPEHLKTIRDRLLASQHRSRVLELYLSILQGAEVSLDDSPEQLELRLSGLVVKHQGRLQVANRIYGEVFNPVWVEQQLVALRPYAAALKAWLASDRSDELCLLRGSALQQAQTWATSHRLTELDYQFLIASQALEWREFQQASVPRSQTLDGQQHLLQELQQTEAVLSRRNAILQAQQEAAIDGILLVNEHQQVVSCNRRFQELWGIPDELLSDGNDQILLEFVLAQLADPQEFLAQVQYLYQHPTEVSRDEILFQDGRVFDRYSSPVQSNAGDYYGRIWFFRDVTEYKQIAFAQATLLAQEKQRRQEIEAAKREAELANCAKSEFIAHMSHELRTPLHAILGFTHLLGRDPALNPAQQETLTIIHQNGERLLSLINHLLRLSKSEADQSILQATALQPATPPAAMTPEMLSSLPVEWINQLHQAALCTDEQQIFSLLERLSSADAALATALAELVCNFRCDKILELTQSFLQDV
jgi:signal transduction histidine kinase